MKTPSRILEEKYIQIANIIFVKNKQNANNNKNALDFVCVLQYNKKRGGGLMSIAVELKKLRQKNNLSMSKVADALGIPKGTYATYEYGTREPNIGMINKIADFYKVSVDTLLGREIKDANTLIEEIEELPLEGQEIIADLIHKIHEVFQKAENRTRTEKK